MSVSAVLELGAAPPPAALHAALSRRDSHEAALASAPRLAAALGCVVGTLADGERRGTTPIFLILPPQRGLERLGLPRGRFSEASRRLWLPEDLLLSNDSHRPRR
jgi:hypothetical protein